MFVDNTLLAAQAEAAERKFMAYDMEGYALSRAAANLSLPMGVLVIRSVADINGVRGKKAPLNIAVICLPALLSRLRRANWLSS